VFVICRPMSFSVVEEKYSYVYVLLMEIFSSALNGSNYYATVL